LMPKTEELQEIIAEFMKVPIAAVDASTVFTGTLASSLGRARLDAMLRSRIGISNPAVYTVKTFGELCQRIGTDSSRVNHLPPVTQRDGSHAARTSFSGKGIAIGVDIQSVADLPNVTDYWEDAFYLQRYTQQEIAYALLQPSPRESFAAIWCAKEALRKADGRWLGVDWHRTEVTHAPSGGPTLISDGETLPCSLSLSHTGGVAIAVVAMVAAPMSPVLQPGQATIRPLAIQPAFIPANGILQLVLSIVAVLISLLAVGIVFLR
jgi:phosphopantetheine--protein transferase-like protein